MKRIIKKILNVIGYELKKINTHKISPEERPVGNMMSLLKDLKTRGLNCSLIMDVGANRSHWSRMAKIVYPDSGFCLIEPQVEMKEDLEKFCTEFNKSFFVMAGAGADNKREKLAIWDDLSGSSLLHTADDGTEQREIQIVTINDIINSKNISIPELIKLDIQGYELEALKGASLTLGKTEVFILEVSLFKFEPLTPVISDVINFMLERGYVVYDFPGFLRRPYDGALAQCDICFVKKDGFLRKSDQWKH